MSRLHVTASGGLITLDDRAKDFYMGPGSRPPTDEEIRARADRLLEGMEEAMSQPICRAKFECRSMTKRAAGNGEFGYEAEFSVVYAGSEENDKYFRATPSGTLKITTFKSDFFVPGKSYYLDFIAAD